MPGITCKTTNLARSFQKLKILEALAEGARRDSMMGHAIWTNLSEPANQDAVIQMCKDQIKDNEPLMVKICGQKAVNFLNAY